MRFGSLATSVGLCALFVTGCLDVREFEGTWTGDRVGDSPELRRGFAEDARAELVVRDVDLRSLDATLTIDGVFDNATVAPIPGAEADVLASMTFDSAPSRIYLSFVQSSDGNGDAMVMVAFYDDPRIDVRVLRGNGNAGGELYGIFTLHRGPGSSALRAAGRGRP